MKATCWISLGANLGDRAAALQAAVAQLRLTPGIEVSRVSSFYETPPWGKTDQPPFLNAAAELLTTLSPLALLQACQRIEDQLGRKRLEHWGPRTIDLDLLHIPGCTVDSPALQLPHPYLLQRAFVLVPLAEIAGSAKFQGHTFAEWRDALPDRNTIRKKT